MAQTPFQVASKIWRVRLEWLEWSGIAAVEIALLLKSLLFYYSFEHNVRTSANISDDFYKTVIRDSKRIYTIDHSGRQLDWHQNKYLFDAPIRIRIFANAVYGPSCTPNHTKNRVSNAHTTISTTSRALSFLLIATTELNKDRLVWKRRDCKKVRINC